MHDLLVVDLSHHNVLIHDGVIESDLVGVIHKATEGTTMIDANYAPRRERARELGLKWASYHYLHPGNIDQQAQFYLGVAAPEPGARVCIDYEDDDLDLQDLRDMIEAIRDLDDTLEITVYGGHLLKEQLGDDHDPVLATTSLWIAQYTGADAPEWPKGTWPVWTLWQYSDGNVGGDPKSIPGIEGTYDTNAFNGSPENCEKWFGPTHEVEQPKIVTVDIFVPPGVEVAVHVEHIDAASEQSPSEPE